MLIVIGMLLLARLASFQFDLDTASYLQNSASNTYRQLRDLIPDAPAGRQDLGRGIRQPTGDAVTQWILFFCQ